jgi:peptidyl-prolyl cis-trans isomerase D
VRALAQQLTRDVQGGSRLQQLAERVKLPVQTVGPFTRVNPPVQLLSALPVIGASFGLAIGETSGPIEAKDGVYFVEPISKRPADSTAFVKQVVVQRAQVVQAARQDRVRQVVAALRDQAKVVDRRQELEELSRKLEESQPAGGQLPTGRR